MAFSAGASSGPVRIAKSAARDVSVKVVVRIRPLLEDEAAQHAVRCINVADLQTLEIERDSQALQYKFDTCYDEDTTQARLYRNEIRPLVACVLSGQNASCFAFGPTGAGKTHTMQGDSRDPGIIPRVIKQLFEDIESMSADGKWTFGVTVSYLEIYNDKVYDLLEFKENDLPIREDQQKNILIPGLIEQELNSCDEFAESFENALRNRATAATKLNVRSSRSHAILLLKVTKKETAPPHRAFIAKMNLVDLAGSEDNRRTDNAGQRLKESGAINKSLFVLSQVVEALNRGDARIPYRDSKLTRLLQDSLGGDSVSCMVANISPSSTMFLDTYNCLNFASKSRKIVNRTAVHRVIPVERPRIAGPPVRVEARKDSKDTVKENKPAPMRTASTSTLSSVAKEPVARDAKEAARPALLHKPASHDKPSDAVPLRPAKTVRVIEERKSQEIAGNACASSEGRASGRDSGVLESIAAMTPGSKQTYARACIMKGKLLQKMNRFGEALDLFEEAQQLFPDSEKIAARIDTVKENMSGSAHGSPAVGAAKPAATKDGKKEKKVLATLNANTLGTPTGPASKRKADEGHSEEKQKKRKLKRRSSAADPDWAEPPVDEAGEQAEHSTSAMACADDSTGSPAATAGTAINLNASLGLKLERDLLSVLNTGDMKALMKISGVGKKRALNIISFRESERPLEQLSDLQLCGFGKKTIDGIIKDALVIRFT